MHREGNDTTSGAGRPAQKLDRRHSQRAQEAQMGAGQNPRRDVKSRGERVMSQRSPEEILKELEEQALEDDARELAAMSNAELDHELAAAGIEPKKATEPPQTLPGRGLPPRREAPQTAPSRLQPPPPFPARTPAPAPAAPTPLPRAVLPS